MNIKTLFFTVVILLAQTSTYANSKIPCASISMIQASRLKLDTAQKLQEYYITYTAAPAFEANGLWWFVGVGDIAARSSKEAITLGRRYLSQVNVQLNQYAIKKNDEYICNYAPGYIQARGKKLV